MEKTLGTFRTPEPFWGELSGLLLWGKNPTKHREDTGKKLVGNPKWKEPKRTPGSDFFLETLGVLLGKKFRKLILRRIDMAEL